MPIRLLLSLFKFYFFIFESSIQFIKSNRLFLLLVFFQFFLLLPVLSLLLLLFAEWPSQFASSVLSHLIRFERTVGKWVVFASWFVRYSFVVIVRLAIFKYNLLYEFIEHNFIIKYLLSPHADAPEICFIFWIIIWIWLHNFWLILFSSPSPFRHHIFDMALVYRARVIDSMHDSFRFL